MGAALYFLNTPAGACLRTLSGGQILRHPQPKTLGSVSTMTLQDGTNESEISGTIRTLEREEEEYLVTWDGDNDPTFPMNFPMPAKLLITFQVCHKSHCSPTRINH